MMRRPFPLGLLALAAALGACGQRIVPATAPAPLPPAGQVETRLFLIGDAGDPDPAGEPVLNALGDQLALDPGRSLVLFLGDNVYPRGLPDSLSPVFPEAARRLDAQVDLLVRYRVRGWFIPGNHDWDRFGPDGWNAIRRQERRIAERGRGLVELEPQAGCPGPVVIDQGQWLRLVLLDSQWWLQSGMKPRTAASGCPMYRERPLAHAMGEALATAGERRVVVAAHHPLLSGGEHGGFFGWRDHLFPLRHLKSWMWLPLPGLGSMYPVLRGFGVSNQDLSGSTYQRMRAAFLDAYAVNPPLVSAAGHDHGLQVIRDAGGWLQLVSGAGIYGHSGPVSGIPGTLLALQEAGFMRLDVCRDGRVRLAVLTADRTGRSAEIYSRWLEPQPRSADHAVRERQTTPP